MNTIPRELIAAMEPAMKQLTPVVQRLIESAPLDFWRCPKCNTLLAKVRLTPGSVVEIKCAKCNTLVKEAA